MKSASLLGIGDVGGERLEIVGQQRRQRDDLLEIALDVALERVDLEVILVAQLVVGDGDDGAQVRPRLDDAIELNALDPLHDQPEAAVGQLEHLVDVGGGADRVQVVLQRLLDRGVALREDADQLADALASSTRRTDASRATASGMNELGNRTVSRSGSTGSSAGT